MKRFNKQEWRIDENMWVKPTKNLIILNSNNQNNQQNIVKSKLNKLPGTNSHSCRPHSNLQPRTKSGYNLVPAESSQRRKILSGNPVDLMKWSEVNKYNMGIYHDSKQWW